MWKRYLDPASIVVGLDIYPACKSFEEEGIKIFIGDQSDRSFLQSVVDEIGKVDFILDDGSHIPRHQIATFEFLFQVGLKEHGVFIVEDCHTSYWRHYGGGLRRKGSFIEYAKGVVDHLNYWHLDPAPAKRSWHTDLVESVEFYSSIVAFRKKAMTPPRQIDVGDVKALDLDAPFLSGPASTFAVLAKRSAFLQGLVRKTPLFWTVMKRLMK
jgi:hypothetical protein